ncbi:ATP-binding protein [Enterococcus rivorum]|uniref:ATP-binding protein n=1 Tax=Enterococcus rivorum TaxID=762845 RepID=UPI000AC86EDA|nr:ATP-binding protein [Enterococcus rivorum]MBP2098811.1 signal recognition particle GTPase [Enterococcus rivorum]
MKFEIPEKKEKKTKISFTLNPTTLPDKEENRPNKIQKRNRQKAVEELTVKLSKQEKKQNKKMKKNLKKILDIHPISAWGESKEESFVKYSGGFFEVVKMRGHNLFGMKQNEFKQIMSSYGALSSLYEPPFKILSIHSPVNTISQQNYYKNMYQKTTDPVQRSVLETKYAELSFIGKYRQMEEYFVFIYGYDEEKLRENISDFYKCCGLLVMEKLTREEKIQLLFRMNNPTLKLAPNPPRGFKVKSKKILEDHINVEMMVRIQPQGNLKFRETAVQTGAGWSTCLHTYRLQSDPDYLWLHPFTKIKDKLLTIDVATQEDENLHNDIAASLRELDDKRHNHKDATVKEIANDDYYALLKLSKNIRKKRDILKFIIVRLYLYADTLDALEKRVIETKKKLEREEFGVANLTIEQREEWLSLFLDYYSQEMLPNRRTGLDVSSTVFGASYPANQVYKMDARGQYIGISNTGGQMMLDFFELDSSRTFYNILLTGLMGYGKTTLMKKIMRDLAGRNGMIRGFDKSGEFTKLILALGGSILRLDGQDGRLNIFEVFALAINDRTLEVDQKACMTFHQSKLATWYSILKPEAPTAELDIFDNLVDDLYVLFKFKDSSGDVSQVTGLSPDKYPILTDLISLIEEEMKEAKNFYGEHLFNIHTTLTKLIKTTNDMFNGPTTVPDLSNQQILFFNIDGLSSFDQRYVNAQLFNAFNLFQSTMFINGRVETKKYHANEITFEEIRRSMFFMAEAHNLLNQSNPRMVSYFNTFAREARKRYAGLCLDTQSIRSLVSRNKDEDGDLDDIYDFMQYRFFFRPGDKELRNLSEENGGDLTENQAQTVGRFKPHQTLLKINSEEAYEMTVYASSEELELFDGGGRKQEAS